MTICESCKMDSTSFGPVEITHLGISLCTTVDTNGAVVTTMMNIDNAGKLNAFDID